MPRAFLPRLLHSHEAFVIREALLVAATDEAAATLISTIRNLLVVWQCPCRCATLHFVTADVALANESRIVADAVGKSISGHLMGLFLWGNDAELHTLEAFHLASDDHPLLPEPTSLRRFREAWPFVVDEPRVTDASAR